MVRQRLLKWVAKAATADTEEQVENRLERKTVNWYRENAKCKCAKKAAKEESKAAADDAKAAADDAGGSDDDYYVTLDEWIAKFGGSDESITAFHGQKPDECHCKLSQCWKEEVWRSTEKNTEQGAEKIQTVALTEGEGSDSCFTEADTEHTKLVRMGIETDQCADHVGINVDDTNTSNHSRAKVVPMSSIANDD